jgi:hypothetical protein
LRYVLLRKILRDRFMTRPFAATVWPALANLREAVELHFEPPVAMHQPEVRQMKVGVGAELLLKQAT